MEKEVQTLFFCDMRACVKNMYCNERGVALKTNNYAFLVMNYLVVSEKYSIFAVGNFFPLRGTSCLPTGVFRRKQRSLATR